MDPKYVAAIKAGIIAAVILAMLALVNNLIDYVNISFFGLSCLIFFLELAVLAGAGAMAVKMAPGLIRSLEDSLAVGAIAGAVTFILGGTIGLVLSFLFSLLKATAWDITHPISDFPEATAGSLFTGICAICCLPVLLLIIGIIGAIVGAIGAAIYYEVAGKP
ncbi:MAG TPA: hypothetical protein VGJ92_12155 [Methanocella sp.]|jgi:hypothetical protein